MEMGNDIGDLVSEVEGALGAKDDTKFRESIGTMFASQKAYTSRALLGPWPDIASLFGGLTFLSGEQERMMRLHLERLKKQEFYGDEPQQINEMLVHEGANELARSVLESRRKEDEVMAIVEILRTRRQQEPASSFDRNVQMKRLPPHHMQFYRALALPFIEKPLEAKRLITAYPRLSNSVEKVFFDGLRGLYDNAFHYPETMFTRPAENHGFDYLRDMGKLCLAVVAAKKRETRRNHYSLQDMIDKTVRTPLMEAQGWVDTKNFLNTSHGLMVFSNALAQEKPPFMGVKWQLYDPAQVFLDYALGIGEDALFKNPKVRDNSEAVLYHAFNASRDSSQGLAFERKYAQHVAELLNALNATYQTKEQIDGKLLGRISTLLKSGSSYISHTPEIQDARESFGALFQGIQELASSGKPSAKIFCDYFRLSYSGHRAF